MPRQERDPRLKPPPAVFEITNALEKAGFQAWCVGGAVRDALLGHPHLDWDFATNATPDQVRTVFGRQRTIPVGIEFGTVGVLDSTGVLHEVTTFRHDVKTDGRHAEVEFGASLDEDLARRDFTINAVAYSATTGEIRDPFEGRVDLERRVVRAVGNAPERMREDRLRALRGMRFAARFEFEIEPATWKAMCESAPHLTRLSAERVRQELEKTMDQVKTPSVALSLWLSSGAARVLVPEIQTASEESRRATDCAAQPGLPRRPGRRLTRLAVLLSDLAPAAVEQAALRLRFSKHDAQWLSTIIGAWQKLDSAMSERLATGKPDGANVRRWIAIIGRTQLGAFFRLASARWSDRRANTAGRHGVPGDRAVRALYRRSLKAALSEPVDLRDLAVDGDDLRQAGVQPGPQLGKMLAALLDKVLDDPSLNTRDRLLAAARTLVEKGA
ncbi:MAG TPA: CCA tRNA nucleotidyltransferase [Gemmatimonadaceae bacterium]